MMTDFQSVCIGLEATQALVFSDKLGFSDFWVQESLPVLAAGPVATKLTFLLTQGPQQVVQWVLDLVRLVPKRDKIYSHPDAT